MEQSKRYIYAVTRTLPQQQRADIEKELQGLIEDMVDERVQDGQDVDSAADEVLLALGHPSLLAAKYRGNQRYLISPGMYDSYLSLLKIVISSIVVALTVVFAIESILDPMQVMGHFTQYVVSLLATAVQGFAWVTITFAIIEYAGMTGTKIGLEATKEWKPSRLPPIPNLTTAIKPCEPITGIICSVLFLVLVTFSVHLLGVFVLHQSHSPVVPFFNEDLFRGYLPLIWMVSALFIVRDLWKTISRKWTRKLVAYHIVCNIVSLLFALVVFANSEVWNARFVSQLVEHGLLAGGSETFHLVTTIWNRTPAGIVSIIAVATLIDTLHMCVRAYRMRDIA